MNKAIQYIETQVEKFNDEIKKTLDGKKITDTGRAKKSLKVETVGNVISSVGVDYIEALNDGRGPGKAPPVDKLEAWTKRKASDKPAGAVIGKIAKEGTEIFKDKSKGLQIEDKVKDLQKDLNENLPEFAKLEVLQQLNKFHKERLTKTI